MISDIQELLLSNGLGESSGTSGRARKRETTQYNTAKLSRSRSHAAAHMKRSIASTKKKKKKKKKGGGGGGGGGA